MKEIHNCMNHLLSAVNSQEHKWLICKDLKVVGLVQRLYTTFCQIRVAVETRVKTWLVQHSVLLIEQNKILLPSLNIKLRLMKNFVKAMDREGSGFTFLQQFQLISMEKLKAGKFDGPQIRELMKDAMFYKALSNVLQSTEQS